VISADRRPFAATPMAMSVLSDVSDVSRIKNSHATMGVNVKTCKTNIIVA